MSAVPTTPGFYWAKWRIADAGVDRMYDYTPSARWDVVEVFASENEDEPLRAYIAGIPGDHSLDGFFWGFGPLVPPASALRDIETPELKLKRAHARYRSMTPDQREEFLQQQRREQRRQGR